MLADAVLHSLTIHHLVKAGESCRVGEVYQDELKQGSLVDLHELIVPGLDLLFRLGGVCTGALASLLALVHVVRAVLEHLAQHLAAHVGHRHTAPISLCR